jgi:hypothetical protein
VDSILYSNGEGYSNGSKPSAPTLVQKAHDTRPKQRVAPVQLIRASPFVPIDPSKIAPRDCIYASHYFRLYLSTTMAAGGTGKSSFGIAEALSMALGRDLLRNSAPIRRQRVWLWNGEDPLVEIQRRIAAACLHYSIDPEDLVGWLFVDSGRDMPLTILSCAEKGGLSLNERAVEQIVSTIRENKIDVVILDPFVSLHTVNENDNTAIDKLAKTLGYIAGVTKCAIDVVHHSRKTNGKPGHEVTVDDGRGASALVAAARSNRVLSRMSAEDGQKAKVENHRFYFCIEPNGKQNMSPPASVRRWFKLVGVRLGNQTEELPEDEVATVVAWQWPDAFDGVALDDLVRVQRHIAMGQWRASPQANQWAGLAVAEVLGLDAQEDKSRIATLIRTWVKSGVLREEKGRGNDRKETMFIVVGERADAE